MSDASSQDQVSHLMDILEQDHTWPARTHALEQLLRLGSPAIPALLQSLETAAQRQFSRYSPEVVEALGRLREPRAVEALILALAQENPHLRQAAAQALGAIGDARAIAPLITSFLVESGDTEDIAAWQNAAQALGCLGAPAVEPLCQALRHEDQQVRIWSAQALGLIEDPRAVEPLIAALLDREDLVRAEAAQALGAIEDQRALGPLKTLVATDPVEYVRNYAARALGHFPAQEVFERLLQVLQDPSTQVRHGAIVALVKTAGTQAMPTLATLLADPEPCIRSAAALGLAKVGDHQVVPRLQQMRDVDHERCGANPVSGSAAYALKQIRARFP